MAVVLNNMGAVYVAQGSGQQALSVLREARQMAEEVNFRPMLPETYALLSAAQRLIGNFHAAFDLAEKALQMAEEVGSMEYAAVAYRTLGRAAARLEQRGDLPFQVVSGGAESYFATSLEILEQVGSLYERARSLQAMGEYLKQTGKPERQAEAETYLQQAADLFERVGLSART
jgi:tetratricopeptide (TPR) repeat protein